MGTIYLCIVIFLLCLAVFDLFVGVSNDAVNFLQSAIGAKVAKFRTVLIIASCGVVLGAIMSSGMMDIARHGIMSPDHFTFEEVMTLFLAVMVTDVIILDVFNTLGMPTSTTVSLVFELLGGAFILATLKMYGDDSLNYGVLLNSNKALEVIMGIFSSVIIAFVFGAFVMWLSRIIFTFNYRKHSRYSIAIFGGIAFTALSYFIFMKGLGKSPYLPAEVRDYIDQNLGFLICITFVVATSKKAQNVIKTSVDLSRQDEGDEMFGSSSAARVIVRNCQATDSWLKQFMPKALMNWINSRFDKNNVELEESAAFDVVRAAVNLVLASMLITIGTNLKLPLSTTYVTFMVAMGSSLADRAWSRESAVFRVTGVLSVIGGWFITAGVAFAACAIVCIIMHFGGVGIQACFMGLVIYLLIRSNIQYNKKAKEEGKSSTFQLMMRSRDPEIVWDLLRRQVSRTQSYVCHFALNEFNQIMDGLANENTRDLRHANKNLKKEQDMLKKFRRQEMLGLKKSPIEIAIERNTWFHLGANSNQQFIYSLRRMLDPIKEHVDNNFNPLPAEYIKEFAPVRQKINDLMRMSCELIETGRYDSYREILAEADACKDELSVLRKKHIDRIQHMTDNTLMQISLVYLNVLQESQEFLSVMRHQLRAAKKFMEK